LNSSVKIIQFQKTNHPKRIPGSEVMIILKSTKFERFSENDCMVFKVSSKYYLILLHYKKRKWICVEISMVHLLHHIHADIYIFKKIFNEHKLAHLRGLLGVKDRVDYQLLFVPSHFFMHCNFREGVSHEVFPLSSFISVYLFYLCT
jgi:hypothetical protein